MRLCKLCVPASSGWLLMLHTRVRVFMSTTTLQCAKQERTRDINFSRQTLHVCVWCWSVRQWTAA
jgi:hypothetical protein